jgi:hypothetical protein
MAQNGGSKKPAPGRASGKRMCSFCKDPKCGNIQSCEKIRAIGCRVKKGSIPQFVAEQLAVTNASSDHIKVQHLLSKGGGDGRALQSLPKATRYIAIQGLYNLLPQATSTAGTLTESYVGVHITCYGDMGVPVPNFQDRIALCTNLREWIAKNKDHVICGKDFGFVQI